MSKQQHAVVQLDEEGSAALPAVEVLTGRAFLTGKSGAGKSNSASVVAEELLDHGFPLLVVDTDGEYWGLKEQYEVLHVGADGECDLQVAPEHAPKLAELALEKGVPIILDVSGYLDADEGSALVRETAKELFQREKKLQRPFLLLVEEIHEYIPEGGGMDATGEMLIRIAKRGRKRGLGIAGMSQRPADVKKDYITQCDWILWHRLTWKNDTQVVRDVLSAEYADVVKELGDGEAFLQSDFTDQDVRRIQVRRKHTFDAGATPDLEGFSRPELKSVSGDLVGELHQITEQKQQEQNRVEELEAEVVALEDEIGSLEEELQNARDLSDMARQFSNALASSGEAGTSEKVEELIEERNRLKSSLEESEQFAQELAEKVDELETELDSRPDISDRAVEAVEVLATEFDVGGEDDDALRRKLQNARERIEELEAAEGGPGAPEPDVLDHPSVTRYVGRVQDELRKLDDYQREMLVWYKYNGPGPVEDAYWSAGGSRKSSARHEKNRVLRDLGLIDRVSQGEYEYAIDEKIRHWWEDNDRVGEDEIAAMVERIEQPLHEESGNE